MLYLLSGRNCFIKHNKLNVLYKPFYYLKVDNAQPFISRNVRIYIPHNNFHLMFDREFYIIYKDIFYSAFVGLIQPQTNYNTCEPSITGNACCN